MSRDKCWGCKVGFADSEKLPSGSDAPMREAVKRAFREVAGHEPDFVLSGWGEELTKSEERIIRRVVP